MYEDEFGNMRINEKQNYGSPFFIIECVCAFWFTLECVLR